MEPLTETFYVRAPAALKQSVEKYAAARGLTIAQAARELLERALAAPGDSERIAELEHRVRLLEGGQP